MYLNNDKYRINYRWEPWESGIREADEGFFYICNLRIEGGNVWEIMYVFNLPSYAATNSLRHF